jgi:hypothetical protein
MSYALNVARVPLLCLWDDEVHRVANPQKGNRPYFVHVGGISNPASGKEQYCLRTFGYPSGAQTHPWTGTTYYYAVTGCPIFAIVSSGIFTGQICNNYTSSLRRLYNRTNLYTPTIDGEVDRAESWQYGRAQKLIGQLPITGRVPGSWAHSEILEFLNEVPTVPDKGINNRIPRRQAQTTAGTTIQSTMLFLCKIVNACQTTVPDPLTYDLVYMNTPVSGNNSGNWQSLLMLNYALENTVLLAAQGFADYKTYVDELIEQWTRCFEIYGTLGGFGDTNRVIAPQIVSGNAGPNWTYNSLADIKTYAISRGNYLTSATNVNQYDTRFLVVVYRALETIKIAADKGRISTATGTKAQTMMNSLQSAISTVTNGSLLSPQSYYGNFFGTPASLVSSMS